MKPVLKEVYKSQIVPAMMKEYGYKNVHQVPRILKIVINSAINSGRDKNWIAEVQKDISNIAGQHAVVTKAKKSISNFKLREGAPNGVMVTLRGDRMYDFLYRLIVAALPTIRDFRGLPRKLDGHGNYTIGITDHTIFPEIASDIGGRENIGMDITIVTSATNDDEGRELLRHFGIPFRKTSKELQEAEAAQAAS